MKASWTKPGFFNVILPVVLTAVFSCNRSPNDVLSPLFEAPASSRPRVISSNPSEEGGAYDPALPVYVDFDREMDVFSTERAFSLSGAGNTSGEFRWIGNRLVYDLVTPLDPGIAFVLRVTGSAKSTNNAPLETDFIVHFITGSTIEAPVVLSSTPSANSQAVSPDSSIVITFSRPMNRQSVEKAFSMNPSTYGGFTWDADDTIMTFQPYSDLQSPLRYSVSLGTSAHDTEGIVLHAPLSFSFQTGEDLTRPTILEIREQGAISPLTNEYDGVQKEGPFIITFSEPMSPADTDKAISLIQREDGSSVSLQRSWSSTFEQLTIDPDPDLRPETTYRLSVSTAAKDVASNALLETYHMDFTVSNASGAINSDYLRLVHAEKTSPDSIQTIDPSPDKTTVITISGSDLATSGSSGANGEFTFDFSHSLDPPSLPESISISRVLGSHPASGRILGIALQNNGPLSNARVVLTIGGLGEGNEYRLRLNGGKSLNHRSLSSVMQFSENATYMQDAVILNLRVQASP